MDLTRNRQETTLIERSQSRRIVGFRGFAYRLMRTRLASIGALIIVIVVLAAIFSPILATHDPVESDLTARFLSPSREHWLGTDHHGRDTYSRIVYGSRVSIQVGIIAVGFSMIVGTTLGLISGYLRVGFIDTLIMRCMDAILAFPTLILALAITAALGASLFNVMIAIGVVATPIYARLIRGQVLSVGERDFVLAAHTIGASGFRIVTRHILPNVTAPLIVQASIGIALAILAEASLSFLGLGVQPPTPSWGGMLATGKDWLSRSAWMAIAPGFAIFIVVLAFNFLGDGIRDALDPHLNDR